MVAEVDASDVVAEAPAVETAVPDVGCQKRKCVCICMDVVALARTDAPTVVASFATQRDLVAGKIVSREGAHSW